MKKYTSITVDQLKVGDQQSFTKQVSAEDVQKFAEATGDFNPAHTDPEYAKNTMFGDVIAHGMLGTSLISALLGMKFPGPGTIYLGQKVKFLKPIHLEDTLTATAEVVELVDKKKFVIATLATTVTNQDGVLLIEGEAQVIPPAKEESE